MANTFFGFDTSLNNGDSLCDDELDLDNEEEEYDALNDETFGDLEEASLDDWEQQHEQFAEIAESSRQSEQIEKSLSQYVLDDEPYDSLSLSKNSVWAFTPPSKNGEQDFFNSSVLSSLQKASKTFIQNHKDQTNDSQNAAFSFGNMHPPPPPPGLLLQHMQQQQQHCIPSGKICTVEELEKNLLHGKNAKSQEAPKPQQGQPHHQMGMSQQTGMPYQPMFPVPMHQLQPPCRGRTRPNSSVLPMPVLKPGPHPPGIPPPGLVRLLPPPPYIPGGHPMQSVYVVNRQLPVAHPFNLLPSQPLNVNLLNQMNRNQHPAMMQQQQQQQQQQQMRGLPRQEQQHHRRNDSQDRGQEAWPRDEYAGLMTPREKQWLLNIQLLQLNTGTPYFDDYYYTVFKEKKLRASKDNLPSDRNLRMNQRQRRNSERQENANTLTPRIYTPLQFENSLGKLQCGSVTAPRKIIDMDVVAPNSESGDGQPAHRDTRKTKQMLLELEAMYSLLLKAEDITNPVAQANMEKLREIKQKQRLKELEMAPTPEQKQEVLRLFKLESEPVVENQQEYMLRIVAGFLQEEKFNSFMNIRKGKLLLLRLLPHLHHDLFAPQLLEVWSKILLSLPIVGKRDTAGDNILPKFYPLFKRYIQTCSMSDILDLVTGLAEAVKVENHRSTPLSHQGRTPLYFVIQNKFGISCLTTILTKSEYILSTSKATDKQTSDWCAFFTCWADMTVTVIAKQPSLPAPLEPLSSAVFSKHADRASGLAGDRRRALEKQLVQSDGN